MIGGLIHLTPQSNLPKDSKRVVCIYSDGMNRIVALAEIQPPDIITVDDTHFGLSKVNSRSIFYKEIVVPDSSIMGRLGEFHPQQR